MMRRMLGAPLGGTTRGGQYGLESRALSLISPPNGIGGGGICFPSIVTVAPGEPGTPVICWAIADKAAVKLKAATAAQRRILLFIFIAVCLLLQMVCSSVISLRSLWLTISIETQ